MNRKCRVLFNFSILFECYIAKKQYKHISISKIII